MLASNKDNTMDLPKLLEPINSNPVGQAREADEAAMREAFELAYERAWDEPSSNEMKVIWVKAWNAARIKGDELLAQALEAITDKPWDDPTYLHARISQHLGRKVQYAESIAQYESNSKLG